MTNTQRGPKGQGSLYQTTEQITRGGKTYTYTYWIAQMSIQDEHGRRAYVRGRGATAAQALSRRTQNLQKRLRSQGTIARRPRGGMTLEEYFWIWLDEPTRTGEQRKPQTKHSLKQQYNNYIKDNIKGPLESITKEEISNYIYRTLTDDQASTRRNAYALLNAIFNSAVRNEIIQKNPMASINAPTFKAKVQSEDKAHATKRMAIAKGLIRWLQNPECPEHTYYPLILCMFLGLRRGELLGLSWKNYHQQNRAGAYLVIEQQLVKLPDRYIIQPSTKTGEQRKILLPQLWRDALKQQKNKNLIANDPQFKDLIFLKDDGDIYSLMDYNRLWHRILRAYMTKDGREWNPQDDWRPHSNRKITASILASEQVSPQIAQTILGHKSEAMTFYYTTVSDQAVSQGMNKLGDALNFDID